MAAAVVDEDEAWLYGDDNSGKENAKVKSTTNGKRKKDDMEEGQLSGEDEGQEKKDTADSEDDDDDDDDDVQVTIGDIRQWSATDSGGNKLFKGSGTYQKPAGVVVSKTGGTTKGVDIEQQGTINGVPTYEFDISSIEDKPWRKPGADITDYFNYGFDEESWTVYCDKQKKLRAENGATYGSLPGSAMKKDISNTTPHASQVATLIGRKAAPPPNRRYYGTIDVIGSTATNTRRPTEAGSAISTITVTGGATEYNPAVPPPGMAPAIPDYSVPPPGLGVPPTLLPPGVTPNVSLPPPNYPPPGFYPPPGAITNSDAYEERNYTYDPATGTYNYSGGPPTWDSRGSYGGGGYSEYNNSRRERSPVSDDEYSMSSHRDRERDRSSSYYRERERDRDRDRDRDSRSDRDRDRRDRDRDRSRDRDRDSSRERRHKDDSKHKKRRFKEEKDSEDHHSSSSKHKKSSRSKKRDKDGEDSTDDKQTE